MNPIYWLRRNKRKVAKIGGPAAGIAGLVAVGVLLSQISGTHTETSATVYMPDVQAKRDFGRLPGPFFIDQNPCPNPVLVSANLLQAMFDKIERLDATLANPGRGVLDGQEVNHFPPSSAGGLARTLRLD